ncbi:MAG: NAD(P)H-dependent oxidoreductase subunit E [Bacillota bacterium]|jgi:NADH-quinone oxidoreductase subunit E
MSDQDQNKIDLKLLEPFLDIHAKSKINLISLLQQAQEIYGYLPQEVVKHISQSLQIPLVRLTGLITFYAQFRLTPPGKYKILICDGTACHVNNAMKIADKVEEVVESAEGKVSFDGLFCWEKVACLGCCSLSPAMMINGKIYGKLTPDLIVQIIEDLRQKEQEGSEA